MEQYRKLFNLFSLHLSGYKNNLDFKFPRELYDPEKYILSLGGKRLRPILSLIACDLFDKDPEMALNSALSVEIFHNFSLVHDDILDAAPLRRNQITVHTKWNTNIAILSGDVMLVEAIAALENYPDTAYRKLVSLLTKTAVEVCEGQQLDMNFENSNQVSVDDYLDMITKKTAVLLSCSLKMGSIIADAKTDDCENIYLFGKHLGIAFQLMDDMLDTFAEDSDAFGKQIGGDILANKKTFLLLKAFELSNGAQKKELGEFLSLGKELAAVKIQGVKNVYNQLNIKNISLEKADEHTSLAISFLDKVQADAGKKENLKQFALALLNRKI